MPKRVVCLAEVIEAEIADGKQSFVALAAGERLLESIAKQGVFWQAGNGIVVRHQFNIGLLLLDCGNVEEQGNVVYCFARFVAQGVNGNQLGIQLAILPAVPDFSFPVAGFAQ